MNTYAIQLELHFQSDRNDDKRFDAFVEEIKDVAARHSIAFGDYQSVQFPAAQYTIKACACCQHLTVDRANIKLHDENIVPDFWFYVRRGNVVEGTLLCDLCRPIARAT